jgi:hypothetical protein
MNFSIDLINFAHGDTKFYEQFCDYHFHKSDVENGRKLGAYDSNVSLNEKQKVVNDAFFAEIEKLSGARRTPETIDAWAANPMVRWATFAIVNALVNAILPAYSNATLAPFVDFQSVGVGDIIKVKVMPKTLYTISLGGKGERTTFRQKKFAGDMTVSMQEHIITTYVDMYRVLARKEDLSDAVRAIVMAVEIDMQNSAYTALNAGLSAVTYPSQFTVSGAFNAQSLIALCQRVQAYNNGVKPIILGTAVALSSVLPDSTLGYRGTYGADGGSVNVMRDFYGFGLQELPQLPTNVNYGVAMPDNKLFIVSPVGSKLVVGGMSTAMTNSNEFYDNADITQNFTYRKLYGFEFVGASFAGVYTISA